MKKVFLISVAFFCVAIILSSLFISSASEKSDAVPQSSGEITQEKIFVDMLNHNFVYGEDFDNADAVINRSVNALTGYETENGAFINQHYVADFVKNMYGICVEDFSGLNADYPCKDGYVYVIPQKFRSFKHSDAKLSYNEDGTVTVKTKVAVTDSKGNVNNLIATSLFALSDESEFGYNIIFSEITEETFSA